MPRSSRALLALLAFLVVVPAAPALARYLPKKPPITTPWTAKVSRKLPLPEYPRPQLVRREWRNLNGQWQFAAATAGERPPFGHRLPETILVPFPMQSALSGIQRTERYAFYRRFFTVPRAWRGRRLLIHFGAVTYAATVYVNGHRVGAHHGSYDAFSFDVTRALKRGRQELVVAVHDPGAYAGGQPVGKQNPVEVSIVHTASSGIWQTVWLEPVRRAHIDRVDSVPDLRRGGVTITPRIVHGAGDRVVVRALAGHQVVARGSARPGRRLFLRIRHAHLWAPDHPFLYRLAIELRHGRRTVDRVRSYFGMRSIALRRIAGRMRVVLNGRPLFQIGPLDQGYWPDGLYTAPTDAALRFDIAETKRLAFNMTRKHVKVEPDRWYYWADRLGLLVWQDMPNMSIYRRVTPPDKVEFERELRAMIAQHRSSPAIVVWTPFNEGWGQYDVNRVVREVKRWDPSRLVNGQSGSANCCLARHSRAEDIRDSHIYQGPLAPRPDRRASAIGEFSACQARDARHEVRGPGSSGGPASSPPASYRANRGALRQAWAALTQEMRTPGLSAAVYTQYSNVEHEIGAGLVSYDRRRTYCGARLLRRLNQRLIAASRRVAELRPQRGAVPARALAVWHFDERRGSVARDASGHHHDLRLVGGALHGRGRHGRALVLDGRSARAVASRSLLDTTRSFTISAWLRYASPTQQGSAVSQGDKAFSFGLRVRNDRPDLTPAYGIEHVPGPFPQPKWNLILPGITGCFTSPDCGVNAGYGDSRIDPRPGRWYHVTGVVDRPRRIASLFVNGEPQDNRIVERRIRSLTRFVVGGGASRLAGGSAFHGRIDDLRVYPRALSPAEAWQLYRAER